MSINNHLETKAAFRLAACDLIWRTFDRPFASESVYQETIDSVSKMLACGRLVVMRRIGDGKEITIESRS